MWKRDYLRHGIENAVRASLSDARLPRFWSGPESFRHRFLPGFPGQIEARGGQRDRRRGSFLLYRAAIGEELLKP